MNNMRREADVRAGDTPTEKLTDTIRIDVALIPDHVKDSLAAATLAFARRFLQEPGGKEYLDARIAARKAARKEAQ